MEVIWIDGGNYLEEFPKYGFDMSAVEVVNLPKKEKNPYTVGVNGVVFAIAAGEELQVPLAIFDILQKEFDEKKKNITPALTTADNIFVHINAVIEYGEIVSASCEATPKELFDAFENGVFCGAVLHINEVLIGGERKQYAKRYTQESLNAYFRDGDSVYFDGYYYNYDIDDYEGLRFIVHNDHTVTIEEAD